jgi:hypothetical protein
MATSTRKSFDFDAFNNFMTSQSPSASVQCAVAKSQWTNAVTTFARFRSPLLELALEIEDKMALFNNANRFYLANRETKTWSKDELIAKGIEIAHQKALGSLNKEQNEANRGRPEIEYPQHTNSGDAGRVAV